MRIVVINLARATERRRKMEAQFAGLDVPFEFLEATDGKTITEAERALVDHKHRRRITPYPLTDNEIGCWLSHRRAMELLIASGDEMVAIIEDDARLSPDLPRVLAAIESRRFSFDVIDLHRTMKRGEIFVPCRPLMPGYDLGRIGYTHMNATGYVVSRLGAVRFLTFAKRFVHAVDKEMRRYWANGLDIYGLSRAVVTHADEGFSYIDETRGQDRPRERERYPNSDEIYWRAWHSLSKGSDSICKRLAFHAIIRRDKRL
jgi:glycosyl transferase family 25